VVGEVRRGEALDMIQSMLSGHAGAMTTAHANTPVDAMIRLETMCLMSGIDMPVHVVRRQVASAVHLVIQLRRYDDGSRRVHSIEEILGLDEHGMYVARPLYEFRSTGRDPGGMLVGQMHACGNAATFAGEAHALGLGERIQLCHEVLPSPVES